MKKWLLFFAVMGYWAVAALMVYAALNFHVMIKDEGGVYAVETNETD